MKKIFFSEFFTVMVHLLIHLASEVKVSGPVHYRWMYPIERYLVHLKDYVRNRTYPKGSIVEGYIADECLTFYSRYFQGVETIFSRPQRHNDFVENAVLYKFSTAGKFLGRAESIVLDQKSLAQAHRYVLLHSDIISDHRSEFLIYQRRANHNIRPNAKIEQRWLVELFSMWLFKKVACLLTSFLGTVARRPQLCPLGYAK
ncbi:uncharacterized protein [Elaeis guineensis]|uniref:uncharacterized protein n=1 Tax=Elaeis guineensis var. tenera TaxID=51953 RepID=UPI003C6CD551